MTSKRAAVLALLVVGAALTGGVGTVSAGGPCDTVDKWIWQVTVGILNDDKCDPVYLSDDLAEMEDLEAQETKKTIHSAAATQAQNNDNLHTTMGNYLEDTENIALMHGKNAYIKALNNGSSEAVARNQATEAVADYYSTKQQNIIAQWNVSVTTFRNGRTNANTTENVSASFVKPEATTQEDASWNYEGIENTTTTLVNASSAGVLSPVVYAEHYDDFDSGTATTKFKPETGRYVGSFKPSNSPENRVVVSGLLVEAPNDNYDAITFVTFDRFATQWSDIETQNTQTQNQLDTFINQTYDAYQAGAINSSDLVDPYLGAKHMGPEDDFQSWALSSTLALGLDGPENLSNVGKMVVQDKASGYEYEGILLSHETPSGGFQFGTTYNASQLNGTQLLITETQKFELSGEFVVKSATTADGQELNQSVTYKTVNYETANTTEYQALMTEIQNLTAELNARQQKLGSGSGGSGGVGWLPDGVSLAQVAPVAVAIGGALVLLNRP